MGRHELSWTKFVFFEKTPDELRDLLDLDSDNYEFKNVKETLGYPISDPFFFHANSCLHNQLGAQMLNHFILFLIVLLYGVIILYLLTTI